MYYACCITKPIARDQVFYFSMVHSFRPDYGFDLLELLALTLATHSYAHSWSHTCDNI